MTKNALRKIYLFQLDHYEKFSKKGDLIEVIHKLSDLKELIWILAGEGPTKAEIAETTAGMDNVLLLPLQPVARLNDWLNLADVHLLPQKASAADLVLPSKLMGILASGKCLVASSPAGSELGNIAEQAGIRVEPEDGAGFGRAIRKLVNNGQLRHQLGSRGRQIAEQYYGLEGILQNLETNLITQKQNGQKSRLE